MVAIYYLHNNFVVYYNLPLIGISIDLILIYRNCAYFMREFTVLYYRSAGKLCWIRMYSILSILNRNKITILLNYNVLL